MLTILYNFLLNPEIIKTFHHSVILPWPIFFNKKKQYLCNGLNLMFDYKTNNLGTYLIGFFLMKYGYYYKYKYRDM